MFNISNEHLKRLKMRVISYPELRTYWKIWLLKRYIMTKKEDISVSIRRIKTLYVIFLLWVKLMKSAKYSFSFNVFEEIFSSPFITLSYISSPSFFFFLFFLSGFSSFYFSMSFSILLEFDYSSSNFFSSSSSYLRCLWSFLPSLALILLLLGSYSSSYFSSGILLRWPKWSNLSSFKCWFFIPKAFLILLVSFEFAALFLWFSNEEGRRGDSKYDDPFFLSIVIYPLSLLIVNPISVPLLMCLFPCLAIKSWRIEPLIFYFLIRLGSPSFLIIGVSTGDFR